MKKLFTAVIILTLLVVPGCGKKPVDQQQQNPIPQTNLPRKELKMSGKMDGKLDIHMHLIIQGTDVSGTYYYDNIKKDIALKGVIDNKNVISINETDNNGKIVGTFEGRLLTGNIFTGTWRKFGDKLTLPVDLVEEKEGSSPVYDSWNGKWGFGNYEKPGASADMEIKNANNKQFEFSIDALFVHTVTGADGQDYLSPNMGNCGGIAYFTSPTEAYFKTKEYSDYKLIFKMLPDNKITIKEINTTNGNDYGASPYCGMNVTLSGTYERR